MIAMDPQKFPKKLPFYKNPVESMREGVSESSKNISNEILLPFADEFVSQILGRKRKFTGEILPGESVAMREVFTGKQGEVEKIRGQLTMERRLREEEKVLVDTKTGELRVQIMAIQTEVVKLSNATPRLAKEIQIASFQAPSSLSIYELFFLQQLFSFIKSFREHIEEAQVWLSTLNRRASKKNMWGQNYKKHGARYLLSGEHYSGRAAA